MSDNDSDRGELPEEREARERAPAEAVVHLYGAVAYTKIILGRLISRVPLSDHEKDDLSLIWDKLDEALGEAEHEISWLFDPPSKRNPYDKL